MKRTLFLILEELSLACGYDSLDNLIQSTFHPKLFLFSFKTSIIVTLFAFNIENITGINLPVLLVAFVLFLLELGTGIASSIKEKYPFESGKLPRGFVKLFIYIIIISCTNILALNMPIKPIFSYEINMYAWIHYTFTNWVIINMIISNLENFIRLGWEKEIPIIKRLSDYLKIDAVRKTNQKRKKPTDE